MPSISRILGSLFLAGFAMLGVACESPCGTPSTGIELYHPDAEPLPPGTYAIEIALGGISARSVCEIEEGNLDEVHCTMEGGDAGGPPPLTLWVSETGTEISGVLTGEPGELTLRVTLDGVEIVHEALVLGTEEVEHPGQYGTTTCEVLAPGVEVELPASRPDQSSV